MNLFEKFFYNLSNLRMETPVRYGYFHLMWIGFIIIILILTILDKKNYSEKKLKIALGVYGFGTLFLELLKQIMWSMDFNNGIVTYSYTWYAAPFQFCSTPMIVAIICFFMKKNKTRDKLLSYLAFFTILGSISTMILPDSCFVEQIIINVHTMYLHAFSLSLSLYVLINKEIDIKFKNLINGLEIFIIFLIIALILDISFYNLGIIGDNTFNMFFISPYFECTLPILSDIYKNVSYPIFLLIYVVAFLVGSSIIFLVSKIIKKLLKK